MMLKCVLRVGRRGSARCEDWSCLCHKAMHNIYKEYKVKRTGGMDVVYYSPRWHITLSTSLPLQEAFSRLHLFRTQEETGTPHVPCGVTERLPINVCFLINIERSNPIHLLSTSRNANQVHTTCTCKSGYIRLLLSSTASCLHCQFCL
jgi:hypothetical protein